MRNWSKRRTIAMRIVKRRAKCLQRFGFLIAFLFVLAKKSLPKTRRVRVHSLQAGETPEIWSYQNVARVRHSFSCNKGWRGIVDGDTGGKPTSVSLVVSFCKHDLGWLSDAVRVRVASFIIYSKCGLEEVANRFLKSSAWAAEGLVISLPNVGRVDHTIAYDMLNERMKADPDSIIVYMKDTYPIVHQRGLETVPFFEMLRIAEGPLGFGCGLRPKPNSLDKACKSSFWNSLSIYFGLAHPATYCEGIWKTADTHELMSVWHLTSELQQFNLRTHARKRGVKYSSVDNATFRAKENFLTWLHSMHISLPEPVTLVCYGGNFAVKVSNILRVRTPLSTMLISLSRGDNILEGHFAERTWAALLASRLPPKLLNQILCMSSGTLPFADMVGCFYGCVDQASCNGDSVTAVRHDSGVFN